MIFDLRSGAAQDDGAQVRAIRFYIGDEYNEHTTGSIRVVLEEMPEDDDMDQILLDSGADAAVFPASYIEAGLNSDAPVAQLHDAQGRQIPVLAMRDVEVRLWDQSGQAVILQEHVAISSHVNKPILCFGKLREAGWSVNGRDQTLEYGELKIPIELQNRSLAVKGVVRMISEADRNVRPMVGLVRVVAAAVEPALEQGPVGWTLDARKCGTGRHHGEHFQDPT